MTLDYTKMFLIVTEEAVVKGHFAFIGAFVAPCAGGVLFLRQSNISLSFRLMCSKALFLSRQEKGEKKPT